MQSPLRYRKYVHVELKINSKKTIFSEKQMHTEMKWFERNVLNSLLVLSIFIIRDDSMYFVHMAATLHKTIKYEIEQNINS